MGLGMTKAFTRAGMKVMMADIDAKRLQAAAADLKTKGADVDTLRCDITIEDSVFAAADATVKRFYYESHDQLRQHLADFVSAYNFARRLKTLSGREIRPVGVYFPAAAK